MFNGLSKLLMSGKKNIGATLANRLGVAGRGDLLCPCISMWVGGCGDLQTIIDNIMEEYNPFLS